MQNCRRQGALFTAHAPSAHPSLEDSSDISSCVKALKSDSSDDAVRNTSVAACCLQLLLVNTSSTAPSIAYQVGLDLAHQLRLAVLRLHTV